MRKLLPAFLILCLGIALTGGILLVRNGPSSGLSKPGLGLLLVGLAGAAGIGFRVGGLGGMDPHDVSAAIRERARKNLDTAQNRSPKA